MRVEVDRTTWRTRPRQAQAAAASYPCSWAPSPMEAYRTLLGEISAVADDPRVDERTREARLVQLAAQMGVELVFVGEAHQEEAS